VAINKVFLRPSLKEKFDDIEEIMINDLFEEIAIDYKNLDTGEIIDDLRKIGSLMDDIESLIQDILFSNSKNNDN